MKRANPIAQARSPLHIQIRERLTSEIQSGDFLPGAQLPTESQIMQEYGVSRGTVIRAIRDLESKGILHRRRGSGTFVSEPFARADKAPTRLHIARFMPFHVTSTPASALQHELNHALTSFCGEHNAMLSLHCIPSGTEPLPVRLMAACEQIISVQPRTVLYCGVEMPEEQMALNAQVARRFSDVGIQVILLDRDICTYPQRSQYTWIATDNRRASTQLVMHMLERGYKRIAFVGIAQSSTAASDRLVGYLDALRAANIPADDSLIFLSEGSPDETLCDRILEQARPDAIVCKDSNFAVRIGQILTRRGIRLGTQMGLAGFDEDLQASFLPTSLTIVRQPTMAIAAAAIRIATGDNGAASSGEHIQIKSELVIQQSTCGPRKSSTHG